jgi:hypothetical protein
VSHSVTVSPRGSPRLEYPSPTLCQSRRHSVAAELFTIQSFSRACPIGHALDISFENWTSSLRIYTMMTPPPPLMKGCRFSNCVSSGDALFCDDVGRLTRCHRTLVSNSCHFFRTPLPIPWRHIQSLRNADKPVRKVPSRDGYPRGSSRVVQRRGDERPAAQCIWYRRSWIVSIIHLVREAAHSHEPSLMPPKTARRGSGRGSRRFSPTAAGKPPTHNMKPWARLEPATNGFATHRYGWVRLFLIVRCVTR